MADGTGSVSVWIVGLLTAYSQYFFTFPVEDIGGKGTVGAEELPSHRLANPSMMLSHVPDMVAMRIEDDVSIGLLHTEEYIHHLKLSLDHEPRVGEQLGRRMCLFEDGMRVFGDEDWCEELVVRVFHRG